MELEQLHRVLTGMLRDLDAFCRRHGIEYYLAGGTLLGAVREGGFIPWDDDADVMMTRENYEKFIAVGNELPSHLFLQCAEADPHWHYPYAKLRLNGTSCVTEFTSRFPEMHQGLFLDIFVQDNTAADPAAVARHVRDIRFWHAVVRWCWHREAGVTAGLRTARPIRAAARFFSLASAEKHLKQAMCRYNKQNTGYLIDSSGMHLQNGAYPAAWLGTPVCVPFGELTLPVPANAHEYLTYLYGDYQTPKEEPPHSVAQVELGVYASPSQEETP